jgi:DNA polymerase-4
MQRTVIHIDIAQFPIAVERVLAPKLRDRPVAVAIEAASRSLIYSLSHEALQNGVQIGMPLHQALKLCPDLTVLPPNEDLYLRATGAMMQILGQYSPVVEPLRFGHAYLDMTGCGKLFGSVKDAAAKAQREIGQQLRLIANAGVASNKLVSKVASDVIIHSGRSSRLYDVNPGYEERFLSPLYVGYLPGVQRTIRQQLTELNVRIIRELAKISSENLQMVFGKFGLLLFQRARGIDNRPVQPPARSLEIAESENLAEDSNDYDFLRARIFQLLSKCARRLRSKQLYAGRLIIEIRYSDYKDDRAQQAISPGLEEHELVPIAEAVLQKAQSRRVRVRKITLRLGALSAVPLQMSLFEPAENPKLTNLIAAMDEIRDRYGDEAIRFGRVIA